MNAPPSPNRPVRIDVSFDAVVTASDGQRVPAVVRDLSASGFRLEIREELLPGEHIILQVGKGIPLVAQIQWSLGNEAGASFLGDVDAGLVARRAVAAVASSSLTPGDSRTRR
jgi:hypothetical protein